MVIHILPDDKYVYTFCQAARSVQADVLELKANPKAEASGVIIESEIDFGRGPLATVTSSRQYCEAARSPGTMASTASNRAKCASSTS